MKSVENLKDSYFISKKIFDEAKERRIKNRQDQISAIRAKIESLQRTEQNLLKLNSEEPEFLSFEEFQNNCARQRTESIQPKTQN